MNGFDDCCDKNIKIINKIGCGELPFEETNAGNIVLDTTQYKFGLGYDASTYPDNTPFGFLVNTTSNFLQPANFTTTTANIANIDTANVNNLNSNNLTVSQGPTNLNGDVYVNGQLLNPNGSSKWVEVPTNNFLPPQQYNSTYVKTEQSIILAGDEFDILKLNNTNVIEIDKDLTFDPSVSIRLFLNIDPSNNTLPLNKILLLNDDLTFGATQIQVYGSNSSIEFNDISVNSWSNLLLNLSISPNIAEQTIAITNTTNYDYYRVVLSNLYTGNPLDRLKIKRVLLYHDSGNNSILYPLTQTSDVNVLGKFKVGNDTNNGVAKAVVDDGATTYHCIGHKIIPPTRPAITAQPITATPDFIFEEVIYNPYDEFYLATNQTSTLLATLRTSTDSLNWSNAIFIDTFVGFQAFANRRSIAVAYNIGYGNSLAPTGSSIITPDLRGFSSCYAITDFTNETILYSFDAKNWNYTPSSIPRGWEKIIYSNKHKIFYAVASTGTATTRACYSLNGIDYLLRPTPSGSNEWIDVIHCYKKNTTDVFVAISRSAQLQVFIQLQIQI
jgi:hypothetical protein